MTAFSNVSRALMASSRLAIGLFTGVFLALVLSFYVSPQFGAHTPRDLLLEFSLENGGSGLLVKGKNDLMALPENLVAESTAVRKQAYDKDSTSFHGEVVVPSPAPPPPMKPICDFSDQRYDGCEMWGDARTASGTNRSRVYFIPPPSQIAAAAAATWSVRSQSRKIVDVREVLVRSLNLSDLQDAPNCTVRRNVPAVVFAIDGLTYNYWHSFSDVLIPLFTTARAFGGEVEFLVTHTGHRGWFLTKYRRVLRALSRYDVVELDTDTEVRCYPHLIVGLRGHLDFDIIPERAPNHYDMFAFRLFVREAYALPPPTAAPLPCKSGDGGNGAKKPRAMIILRGTTRRFVNPDAIVAAVEAAGFDVVRLGDPASSEEAPDAVAREVDACDLLVGAHGAGLTNMLFLRTGAAVVQVVPWGKMEPYCEWYFGWPAVKMGVRHVMYSISAEESTLYDKYGKDHPVITDPDRFYKNDTNGKYYWHEQNIRLNTTRFMPTLEKVKRMLLQE